jgi:flagellar motor switch protein FliN/FliY
MTSYFDCWIHVARDLFAQALAGEPELTDSLAQPCESASFGFMATVAGDEEGVFTVEIESSILEAPLLGEGVEQKAGWKELLREICDAAAGELLARSGKKSSVVKFEEAFATTPVSRAFQLKSGERSWTVLVRNALRCPENRPPAAGLKPSVSQASPPTSPVPSLNPGFELLLDVELEASLRFGCREMPLGEILELGPGDVVRLDRHVSDPVDLIVGDKIVARGEVILVNGNFGLRVSEVATPRKRLESIRCLF